MIEKLGSDADAGVRDAAAEAMGWIEELNKASAKQFVALPATEARAF